MKNVKIFRNADGTYDCNGSITIRANDPLLKKDKTGFIIPFNKIKGSFKCDHIDLIGLVNCPQIIDNDFHCQYNELTSLEGGPKEVGGYYDCSANELVSLKGSPEIVPYIYIFDCGYNKLINLIGGPKRARDFYLMQNKLTSLDGIPEDCEFLDLAGNPITKKLGKTDEEVKNKIIKKKYNVNIKSVSLSLPD